MNEVEFQFFIVSLSGNLYMRGVGRIIQIGFISMETKLIMAIRMATKLLKLMSSNSMGKRIFVVSYHNDVLHML